MWLMLIILIFFLLLYVLFEFLLSLKGDCKIIIDAEKIIPKYYIKDNTILVYIDSQFLNKGKQQGLIIDCTSRIQPEIDKFSNLNINSKIINLTNPRDDNYWEACIIKAGKTLPFRIVTEIPLEGKKPDEIFNIIENFKIDLLYKFYGRSPMTYARNEFSINIKNITYSEVTKEIKKKAIKSHHPNAMPVKTHLLRPGTCILEVIKRSALQFKENKNLIAIAESALAIMQGRIKYVEDIKPGFLARKLTRLFDKDSSMSSVYSLEMAFREAGALKILFAALIGTLGKMLGRKGDFYRIAGKMVTAIDDCTGTIPPFDKYIVLCPTNLKEITQRIKKETGLEAAVVDVNDLKRVDILASTCPEENKYIAEVLIDNPQGNANEQTPMVIIKL